MHGRALLRQHEHTFGSQFCQKQIKTSYLWLAFFFFLVPFRLYDSEHIWITRALDWNVAIRGENEANFKVSSLQRCLPLCITRFLFFWKKRVHRLGTNGYFFVAEEEWNEIFAPCIANERSNEADGLRQDAPFGIPLEFLPLCHPDDFRFSVEVAGVASRATAVTQ